MKISTILLAGAFAILSTAVLAQSNSSEKTQKSMTGDPAASSVEPQSRYDRNGAEPNLGASVNFWREGWKWRPRTRQDAGKQYVREASRTAKEIAGRVGGPREAADLFRKKQEPPYTQFHNGP